MRRRSDGVINDRVFNTLYGLAYKLRAVHRSSWQRINGRGAEHEADLAPSFGLSLFTSFVRTSPRNRFLFPSVFLPLRLSDLLERVIVSRFPSIAPVYPSSFLHVSHGRRTNADESLIQR